MDKYLTEFIGSFFLVLTIGATAVPALPGVIAPLAIGAVLTAMIYAGRHISGAHYNPAVTFGIWMRGRIGANDIVPYWFAQIAGAVVAAFAVDFLRPDLEVTTRVPDPGMALVAELVFTFALVYVIFNVATSKHHEGNSFYGLAIGLVVVAGVLAVGDISGSVFNPAVAIGLSMMGLSAWGSLWIFLVANFLAAAAAAVVFRISNPDDA